MLIPHTLAMDWSILYEMFANPAKCSRMRVFDIPQHASALDAYAAVQERLCAL
jgi:hypothetical protein